jgi:hypothetical protein
MHDVLDEATGSGVSARGFLDECGADQTVQFVDCLDAKSLGARIPYPRFFPLLFFIGKSPFFQGMDTVIRFERQPPK